MGATPPRTPYDDDTDERQNYIINPSIQPVVPPKGDVQTGQPVGPAFTAMPRDAQRAAVDRTYGDMIKDYMNRKVQESARLTKGPFHTQGGIDKAAGGAMGSFGVVANPESGLFQQLLKRMPKLGGALQKMKPTTEYAEAAPNLFTKAHGVTSAIPNDVTRQAIQAGELTSSPYAMDAAKLGRLASRDANVRGATFQSFPKTGAADETLAHEGYHALYAGKYPATQAPNVAGERAFDLMERILKRAGLSDNEILLNMVKYAKDPQHGIVDALGRYQAIKSGGMQVAR